MTDPEKRLLENILKYASEVFSNHGSNDMGHLWEGISDPERKEIALAIGDHVSGESDYECEIDHWAMSYLSQKLKDEREQS